MQMVLGNASQLLTSYANPKEALMMKNNFNILVVSFVGMEKLFRALLGVLSGARRQGSREVAHGMCSLGITLSTVDTSLQCHVLNTITQCLSQQLMDTLRLNMRKILRLMS
jgi:hypothetical protein